jgi:hypothetical protein
MTDCAGCEQYECYRGDPCTRGQDDLQARAIARGKQLLITNIAFNVSECREN